MDVRKAQPWDEPWGRGCEVCAAARLSEWQSSFREGLAEEGCRSEEIAVALAAVQKMGRKSLRT